MNNFRDLTHEIIVAGATVSALCKKAVEDGIITPEQADFIMSEYLPVFLPQPWYKRWTKSLGFSSSDTDSTVVVRIIHASDNAKVP